MGDITIRMNDDLKNHVTKHARRHGSEFQHVCDHGMHSASEPTTAAIRYLRSAITLQRRNPSRDDRSRSPGAELIPDDSVSFSNAEDAIDWLQRTKDDTPHAHHLRQPIPNRFQKHPKNFLKSLVVTGTGFHHHSAAVWNGEMYPYCTQFAYIWQVQRTKVTSKGAYSATRGHILTNRIHHP